MAEDVAPAAQAASPVKDNDSVSTGVAKGRDRLDSATSTSILREADIQKLAPRSIGELLRAVPGLRSEAAAGEAIANFTIRGLPISTSGGKFVQLQEDGLPILEFGDILGTSADAYLRADLNLAQLEVIRGGSASTFASNSPGGIINFISKTGDVEGGAIALTTGIDYEQYRADFDYGAKLTDTVRFHVGGFYRQGEGPRRTGYDAQKGGQIKLNVTKELSNGYIRLYLKHLDDRSPYYDVVPMRVTGTNDKPTYSALPGFDPLKDTLASRYFLSNLKLDRNNNPEATDLRDGHRSKMDSFGLETRLDLAGWTVTERFRYARISGGLVAPFGSFNMPAFISILQFAGSGGSLSYANGPNAGARVNVNTINGNGIVMFVPVIDKNNRALDNITNDIRASRVWPLGSGDLTTTAGFYAARQTIDADTTYSTVLMEALGGGQAALLNLTRANGTQLSTNGFRAYDLFSNPGVLRQTVDVDYRVNAPFASLNYHLGKVSVGASVRYDFGGARGQVFGAGLRGGRVGTTTFDLDRDGNISPAEQRVAITPLNAPGTVNYDYGYLSYSGGINFRVAESLALFARYSRGARANADRILFSPLLNSTTGKAIIPGALVDVVRQAEGGVKFRRDNITLNLTGFWARAEDTNLDTNTGGLIQREYSAKGLEFEGAVRHGPFSLSAGATYTKAEISQDKNPAFVGQQPRHQPDLIFQATPQVTLERFNIGAVFIGATDSYSQNLNRLKMPGFVTTNAFVQIDVGQNVLLSLNANNLLNTVALMDVASTVLPADGAASVRTLNGRTVSATVRVGF
ncbi:TonB-dependent receptor domain-containing protein [Sphingomonas hankookensis]|nr:TonB-dependent receptor [Sphingomonas hankookensis]